MQNAAASSPTKVLSRSTLASLLCLALGAAMAGCSSEPSSTGGSGGQANSGNGGTTGSGGSTANGGSGTGGTTSTASGGTSNGGASNGGATGQGGASNGGTSSQGGAAQGGGTASGGSGTSGGSSNGGSSSGGTSSGGATSGGATSGGNTAKGGGSSGGTSSGGSSSGGSSSGGSTGVLKIMAVGDSITASTCWRAKLWSALGTAHPGRFDLVGTLQSDAGCTPSAYDKDNQGYGSSLVSEAAANVTNKRTCQPKCPSMTDDFGPAFMSAKPDIALIHYGTNDVWQQGAVTTQTIINAYGTFVDSLRAANPNVKILIAKIIPMNVTSTTCTGCTCASCGTGITSLNSAIDTWAPTKSTSASPIIVVDQYTGFDATADTRDGVHPNDSGSQKMATKWQAALDPLF
ncbi:MAG: SGNH/GDSL hydrolase family protein [Polyangiaceae bacterium]